MNFSGHMKKKTFVFRPLYKLSGEGLVFKPQMMIVTQQVIPQEKQYKYRVIHRLIYRQENNNSIC